MATTIDSGKDFVIKNVTLNSSTDTALTFDNKHINAVVIRCRSSIDIYVRRASSDSTYFTIPSGTSLTIDISIREVTPLYLRSASGTPVAEVLATLGG